MSTITLEINGLEIVAEKGLSVLDIARRAEIDIPSVCTINGKTSEVPCGLCLVEIEGVDEPVRACRTPGEEGMKIVTDNEEIRSIRASRLAAVSSTHFGDCKAPCNLTCPGQINVQGYIAHIRKGEYEEALRLIMEKNPFPFSVGRVCPRFCETRCRRLLVDESIAINHLKRFVADWCMASNIDISFERGEASGRKVAVIGGGPAGMTSAFYLSRKGHDVTVFEANPKLGGMLRYGLPEYKIPRDVLDYELDTLLRLGISVRLSQRWGSDFTLQDLKEQGYDAILITVGAGKGKPLEIEGATHPRVWQATEFLKEIATGSKADYGHEAAVIGGNNIAMETARSLLRQNVDSVTVVYFRGREEMPANQRNIREAEEEGVQFLLMASPVRIQENSQGALEVELVRMRYGKPDEKGKRFPEAIPGTSQTLRVDTLISSQGQMALSEGGYEGELESQLELKPGNIIKASPRDSATSVPGIFAAGDAASGTRSVIQAIVSARRAADNIDAYITGNPKAPAPSRFNFTRGSSFDDVDLANFDGIPIKLREKMPGRPPERAVQDFDEVKLGFNEKMARKEAERCLSCGCKAFEGCELKQLDIDYKVNLNKTGMGRKPVYPVDASHPAIEVDLNKCIYCQRCKNSCEYYAVDLSCDNVDDDGNPSGINFRFNENCVSCGRCVDHCPTGALTKKAAIVPVVDEEVEDIRTTCPYCGVGCQIILRVKGNTIIEATADNNQAPNYGALCVKGRFGHDFVKDKSRLTTPLVRRDGRLVPTSWDDALEVVARNFFDVKAMYGSDSIAGFSCARATNEENFLMQKFMRTVLG
ncbi:MAG: FAD-dependent oxidoreductase, partial [Desulfurivibrionaceae bacterium]